MNRRFIELIIMLSNMIKIEEDVAENILRKTKIGQAILLKDSMVMYDQQTANLSDVIMELKEFPEYEERAQSITPEEIVRAFHYMQSQEKKIREMRRQHLSKYNAQPKVIQIHQESLKKKQVMVQRKINEMEYMANQEA